MTTRTVRRALQHEGAKRKGSRFIAGVWPLDAAADAARDGAGDGDAAAAAARRLVAAQRAQFPGASHHCFALATRAGRELSSDAGEPRGAAGRPILAAIRRARLAGVCVVVSRVFGGVKLGLGGLQRAYGEAAADALALAEVAEEPPSSRLRVAAPLALADAVRQAAARVGAQVVAQDFGDGARFELQVEAARAEKLADLLRTRSAGGIRVERE